MSCIGTRIAVHGRTHCVASSSRTLASTLLLQTRGIKRRATPKTQKQQNGEGGPPEEEKRIKPAGPAFKALPPNQLKGQLLTEEEKTILSLPLFPPRTLTAQTAGTAMEFTKTDGDILRAYGVPRNLLVDFRVLSKPCSVVRDVTVSTIERLRSASNRSSEHMRMVLTGPRGCGKSVLLLQAAEYCAANDWIVLYIPRGINLVNSSTQYIYDPRTRTYLQPEFSYEVLRRFAQVNRKALEGLKTTEEFVYDRTAFPTGTTLLRLAEFAADADKVAAPIVLDALLAELGRQKRYPILFAVDDIQAIYNQTSQYRDQRFQSIKPWHLSLPRLILEYTSGKRIFQRGAILGALSCSDTRFRLPLELSESLKLPFDGPSGPYVRRKPELVEYANGLTNVPVPAQLQVNEAASIFEVWMKDKALFSPLTDETFMATYTQASGNAKDFVWRGLLGTFTL